MAFDAHKNLAISTVATAPSPATSGTTISVTAGEGGRFPAAPFNATVWPASQPPTPANAELVRVTAVSGDGLTIVRATESSTARSIVAGDLIAATITAKVITDIESGTNFPAITTTGTISGGHFGMAGNIYFSGAGAHTITLSTPDGADNGAIQLGGGGAPETTRGGSIALYGNEAASPGAIDLIIGDVAGSRLRFYTGPGYTIRGQLHPSGGFSWGGTTDPGAGAIVVGATGAAGSAFLALNPNINGLLTISAPTAAGGFNHVLFNTPSGLAGYIQTSGTTTTYGTTSDARLKTDRGLLTDPEVLRHTKIHHFTWNADGTVGHGVFAQEAITVAPFAVSVGTDERDDDGRLKQPWGVDYSKYVPDLIAGWQHHDTWIKAVYADQKAAANRIACLEGAITTMRERRDRPSLINRVRTMIRAFGQWWMPSWV